MICSESLLTAQTTIQRLRVLPVPGTVLRRAGDQVAADTVVAEADQKMGYRLLDLSKMMGVRISDPRKVLLKKRGDTVEKDEIIARTRGLIKTECASPVSGTLIDARESKVLIEVAPQHIALAAFYPGQVTKTISDRGVMIQVVGAVVQGMWGTGEQIRAKMQQAAPDGETLLQTDQIGAGQMGAVLLGGRTLTREAIENVVQNKVSAVIVGSISSDLIPVIQATPLSLIVTEGFGDIGMSSYTFELLLSCIGREVCFNPQTNMRRENTRPEIVIPLPASEAEQTIEHIMQIGTRVRALRAPYQGVIGRVVALPSRPRRLESGIQAYGAEVDLELVGQTFVPLENLEIVH